VNQCQIFEEEQADVYIAFRNNRFWPRAAVGAGRIRSNSERGEPKAAVGKVGLTHH